MRWDMQGAQTAPMVDAAIRLPPQQKINVFSGATYRLLRLRIATSCLSAAL